jgi:hypothetical protein
MMLWDRTSNSERCTCRGVPVSTADYNAVHRNISHLETSGWYVIARTSLFAD